MERKGGEKDIREDEDAETIIAARKAPTNMGGWEYLVKWEGGGKHKNSWQPATNMEWRKGEMKQMMKKAREEKEVPTSFREWLEKRSEGNYKGL